MDNKATSYTGTDNLEVMKEAKNYNQFLCLSIINHTNLNDQILDFGAGIGFFAQKLFERGYTVNCIEPDEQQALMIRNHGITAFNHIDSIKNDSMDFVYSLNVLEHIENDSAALVDIYQKMKPGGKLFLYVPALQILYSSMDKKVGHYRRYNRNNLENIVKKAGFKIIKSRYADSLGFFATLLYKWIGNDAGTINPKSLVIYDRLFFPISRMLDYVLGFLFGKNVMLVAKKT